MFEEEKVDDPRLVQFTAIGFTRIAWNKAKCKGVVAEMTQTGYKLTIPGEGEVELVSFIGVTRTLAGISGFRN